MLDQDHFERLGLPRRFALDETELERNYLARSRALHPDFHQLASTGEQQASLEMTARLNEAASILRDPFKRAEYLLTLAGGPSASEQKEMPAEFLEEMLELRMAIEELRESEPHDSPSRQEMEKRLSARRAAMIQGVATDFDALAQTGERATVLRNVRRRLNALKYLQNLLRDLKA